MNPLVAFRRMLLIRHFEERCVGLNASGEFPGVTPAYVGQEATGVALGMALQPSDQVFSTHRDHGHLLGRGADPRLVMAEIYGKASGYCGGKAGSFHVSSSAVGLPAASAIVSGSMPTAVGMALAFKVQRQPNVAVACFGDRALNEGTAWESLNLAAYWQVPVVFLCENNDAIPYDLRESSTLAASRVTDIPQTLSIHAEQVDGSDLARMQAALERAVEHARTTCAPAFVEAMTVGWPGGGERGHALPDELLTHVSHAWEPPEDTKHAEWRQNEPIVKTTRQLLDRGAVDQSGLQRLEEEVLAEVDAAVKFAREAPFPEPSSALEGVYADD